VPTGTKRVELGLADGFCPVARTTTTTKSFSPWTRGGIRSGLPCELNYLPAASLGKERIDVTSRRLETEELSLHGPVLVQSRLAAGSTVFELAQPIDLFTLRNA
jgi:hypothetical protein